MAHTLGPCRRAKRCANESGSAFSTKLISPWRESVTFLWRWGAIAVKPIRSKICAMAAGSGAAYSMNSKPSVPAGFSQGVNFMALAYLRRQLAETTETDPAVALRGAREFQAGKPGQQAGDGDT